MRQPLTIVLIIVLLLQTCSKWLVIAGYEMNKAYIAKVLCENKSKPQLSCHGKCHLRKQLLKEVNGNENNEPGQTAHKFQEVFFDIIPCTTVPIPAILSPMTKAADIALYSSAYTGSVFHPPGFIVHT